MLVLSPTTYNIWRRPNGKCKFSSEEIQTRKRTLVTVCLFVEDRKLQIINYTVSAVLGLEMISVISDVQKFKMSFKPNLEFVPNPLAYHSGPLQTSVFLVANRRWFALVVVELSLKHSGKYMILYHACVTDAKCGQYLVTLIHSKQLSQC